MQKFIIQLSKKQFSILLAHLIVYTITEWGLFIYAFLHGFGKLVVVALILLGIYAVLGTVATILFLILRNQPSK